MSTVRPSRQPLRDFLRMRIFLNVINDIPYPEEHLKGASRSTHDVDAALRALVSAIFFHEILRGSEEIYATCH